MVNVLLLIVFIQMSLYGASNCPVPSAALTKVRAYLSYESRDGLWRPGLMRFSFAEADGDALFFQQELPRYSDEAQRWVYVFRQGSRLLVAGCPNTSEWTKCAETSFREFIHAPQDTFERLVGSTCDLSILVMPWRPSPDSPVKRKLASQVLEELLEYGVENPRQVYVRDFNIADPELDFYIVDREGRNNLQGCAFDANQHPHCAWHLYGMSPLDQVKAKILAQPYRLLPPAPPPDRQRR